ncbi:hypothetical protein TVAGG3_0084820 [Trichomonas vaginalis G3]|uniref:hypothetical protein n=1 Tax=Trichomonas vaginalis (strain ATCC PRA-98 / G3) TaxID=412133 RepID=UPI0021E58484|nr:hypothetical protein TVAGG3_0084820 [Trichomonas vaginalis G3]KAI5543520.1 hypothetical protein TVAGG3_0084820 [Trichomonas vaginalis G3]
MLKSYGFATLMTLIWFQVDDTESETDESWPFIVGVNSIRRPEQIAACFLVRKHLSIFPSTNYKSINRNKDENVCHAPSREQIPSPEVI